MSLLNPFIEALTVGITTGVVLSLLEYRKMLKYFRADFKPFNCSLCAAFWACIAFGLFTQHYPTCLFAAVSSLTAVKVDKILHTF